MTAFLFQPLALGPLTLPHRVAMAPITRSRTTQPGDVPNAMMAKYHAQRASAALIVTEATQISTQGQGYSFTQLTFGVISVYNDRRPHSSLGGQTPDQAYLNTLTRIPAAA